MLYKYLPTERVDVIENLNIRFSPFVSLNDPFESQPLINVENRIYKANKEVLSELDDYWKDIDKSDESSDNYRLYKQQREVIKKGVTSQLNPKNQGSELIKTLGDKHGILSLSRTNKNLLMWSHYSSSHAGYVLGFNDSHEFFSQKDERGNTIRPLPVIYTKKRSIVKIGEDRWYQKLLCEKPIDWRYEEEERLFITFQNNIITKEKDSYGMSIILTDIPKEAITKIYIGCKATDKTKELILKAVKNNNLNIQVYNTSMSNKDYEIKFTKI